jgi:hypothetical protein
LDEKAKRRATWRSWVDFILFLCIGLRRVGGSCVVQTG